MFVGSFLQNCLCRSCSPVDFLNQSQLSLETSGVDRGSCGDYSDAVFAHPDRLHPVTQKYVLHFAVQPPVLFEFDDYRLSKSTAFPRAQVLNLTSQSIVSLSLNPLFTSVMRLKDVSSDGPMSSAL